MGQVGTGPHEILQKNTCISDELIHRHKGFKYVFTTWSNLQMPQDFSAFLSYEESRINQYCVRSSQVPQLI